MPMVKRIARIPKPTRTPTAVELTELPVKGLDSIRGANKKHSIQITHTALEEAIPQGVSFPNYKLSALLYPAV